MEELDDALGAKAKKDPAWKEALPGIADRTLKLACSVGKGRFAQIVARHAAASAGSVPPYVADAVKWISGHAAD